MIFLDEDLANILVNGNKEASKTVALYLIMKNNRLFSEFAEEVFIAKVGSDNESITKADIVAFFEKKKQESRIVANWKPYVIVKLGQVFLDIIYKSGLIEESIDRKRKSAQINVSTLKDLLKYL